MGEAGRDTQVTFTFREWASAKATGLQATQCLYGCSSVAQLNECRKTAACDAATYSVIGTQGCGCDLCNPEFSVEKPTISHATSTKNDWYCPPGHALGLTQDAAQNSPQWHNCRAAPFPQTGFPMLQLILACILVIPAVPLRLSYLPPPFSIFNSCQCYFGTKFTNLDIF